MSYIPALSRLHPVKLFSTIVIFVMELLHLLSEKICRFIEISFSRGIINFFKDIQ